MSDQEREDRLALWRQLRGQLSRVHGDLRLAAMVAFELGEDDLGRDLREIKDQISLNRIRAHSEVEEMKGVVRESTAD